MSEVSIFSVKPPKRLYRGVFDKKSGMGIGSLGNGLYSSTDRMWLRRAFEFDSIITLTPEEAFPRNPLVLYGCGDAQGLFRDWTFRETGLRLMDFNKKYPDPSEYVRSRGFDGVVAGDEVVWYDAPNQRR